MAVNLSAPDPQSLHAVRGLQLGVAMAGIRKPGRKDLLVMRLAPGATVAGVFTQNRFCAAPVLIARKHIKNEARALVINTGNANAGTGEDGLRRAMQVCDALAHHLGCSASQILPFSTGVIAAAQARHRYRAFAGRDDVPLFSRFQIEHQIESAYSRQVALPWPAAGGRAPGASALAMLLELAGRAHPHPRALLDTHLPPAALPSARKSRRHETG